MKRVLLICLLLAAQSAFAEVSSDDVTKFFYSYVNALESGDYLSALNSWSLLDRTWSDQLGIVYRNLPVKLEANSVLMHNLAQLKSGAAKLSVDTVTMSRGYAKINFRIVSKDTVLTGSYYALTTATVEPSLTSPLRVFTDAWEQNQSKYVDLIYRDLTLYQENGLNATDQFIDETARTLNISDDKIEKLAKARFRVVLCESQGEVQMLTGVFGTGEFLQSVDAVVSKFMPPTHDLAKFLVAYAEDSLPVNTLPFIGEGTATFLGGRSGRSAEVMMYIGSYIYLSGNQGLDTLLTYNGFMSHEGNPDFSYPVAGLFCKFLFEKLGNEKYFRLYRRFSGSGAEVRGINPAKFKEAVTAAYGKTWDAVEKEFKQFASHHISAGIFTGAETSGKLVYESGKQDFTINIYEDSADYNVVIKSAGGNVRAALVVGSSMQNDPYRSSLYLEYFPDSSWQQQHYALIFDTKQSEAGTYDFYTNMITGKFSSGFSNGASMQQPGTDEYRFRVAKRLIPDLSVGPATLVVLK